MDVKLVCDEELMVSFLEERKVALYIKLSLSTTL